MNSVWSIGVSGMRAAQQRMDLAGHHIAHVATPGLPRLQVVQHAQDGGGVRIQLAQAEGPGQGLAADLVELRQAQQLFTANLRTVQAADDRLGRVLDLFG
jgi:flagellar hook-associated protein FlgK